ncbi:hypothetical protein GQS40_02410|uniref:Uncharacterized protein n=1 Tax=Leuconostoc lactis TaxID=1246 RepID=A0A6L7A9H4_LEULA|nr:hypothetical protein [Leuconostoc lactis]
MWAVGKGSKADIVAMQFGMRRENVTRQFSDYWQAGLSVGRDIMGTLVNVLFMIFIAETLPMVFLMLRNGNNWAYRTLQMTLTLLTTVVTTGLTMLILFAVLAVTHGKGVHFETMSYVTQLPKSIFMAQTVIGVLGAVMDEVLFIGLLVIYSRWRATSWLLLSLVLNVVLFGVAIHVDIHDKNANVLLVFSVLALGLAIASLALVLGSDTMMTQHLTVAILNRHQTIKLTNTYADSQVITNRYRVGDQLLLENVGGNIHILSLKRDALIGALANSHWEK